MRVWVTGSNGMLARAIKLKLTDRNVEFIGTGRGLDIGCARKVQEFARAGGFTHIINCAAYTDVDGAQNDASSAYQTNTFGPSNLALAAAIIEAHLVHFSTEYVFRGNECRSSLEGDDCNPLNVYGMSKHSGEVLVSSVMRNTGKSWYVIRTSGLFGLGGKNFVSTMLKLMAEKEVLRVVSDQVVRPTFTDDLAWAALKLVDTSAASGIYHFANSVFSDEGSISWYDFAGQILKVGKEAGLPLVTRELVPIPYEELGRPALRPAHAVLNTRLFRETTGEAPREVIEVLREYLGQVVSQGSLL